MKTRIVLLAVIIASVVWACSKSSGGGSSDTNTGQGADESKIQGNWKDSCKSFGGGGFERSTLNTISVVRQDLIITGNTFNGTTCSGAATDAMKIKFKFEIPSHSNIDSAILNFNSVLQSISQIVYDQDAANAFNTMAYCGFTDWVVGVEKDITGLSCLSGSQAGNTIYSIVKATDTTLQFGESDSSHDGSTEKQRHTTLSAVSFTRTTNP